VVQPIKNLSPRTGAIMQQVVGRIAKVGMRSR
jgi:hypothetical protein